MNPVILCSEDPKYNGLHVCPKCGGRSEWQTVTTRGRVIEVSCAGDCGRYTMSYVQLSGKPHFKLDS